MIPYVVDDLVNRGCLHHYCSISKSFIWVCVPKLLVYFASLIFANILMYRSKYNRQQ